MLNKSYIILIFLFISKNTFAQQWQQVGNWKYIEGPVYEIFTDTVDNLLYFGGQFDTIDNKYTGNICQYDGSEIKSVKIGVNDCWNLGCRGVFTMGRYKNKIIASVIRSTDDTDSDLTGIGSWNGQEWKNLGKGVTDFADKPWPGTINDFQITNDTLYVAGWFEFVDDIPQKAVAAWDGTNWHDCHFPLVGNGTSYALAQCVSMYKNELYVGGNMNLTINGTTYYDLFKYDGNNWVPVGTGIQGGNSIMLDMEVYKGKLYMAGNFLQSSGNPGNCIMSWDGEKWDDLGGGALKTNGYEWINKMVVANDKLYVVGRFDQVGDIPAYNVASWDGEKWCSVGKAMFETDLESVAVFRDTVYVCGNFDYIDNQVVRRLAKFIGNPADNICGEVATKNLPNSKTTLQITPNPATEAIRVTLPTVSKSAEIRFINTLGQVFLQKKVENLPEPALVQSIDTWPAGLYFVEIRGADGVIWGGRFLKE